MEMTRQHLVITLRWWLTSSRANIYGPAFSSRCLRGHAYLWPYNATYTGAVAFNAGKYDSEGVPFFQYFWNGQQPPFRQERPSSPFHDSHSIRLLTPHSSPYHQC
ncbi:hypothetical protein EV421DRAFT_147612 [Armillaria borealis]|uniref:Uncharacterized protein n=1 Tax=Armillaria borealis TaxID=47425 RepID=A0AA39JRN6_9AGAR|nr:hypothetical protein EV421DRAFT_147612 [Armillaria borealis]